MVFLLIQLAMEPNLTDNPTVTDIFQQTQTTPASLVCPYQVRQEDCSVLQSLIFQVSSKEILYIALSKYSF